MKRMGSGFTIVELLIVIVVIAILAAISIAAYTNISNRANDAAVQSDLKGLATKLEMSRAESGQYLSANIATGQLATLDFKRTKTAYQDVNGNLSYCSDGDSASRYAIAGLSKSGKIYYISSENASPQRYTGEQGVFSVCLGIIPGLTTNYRGYTPEEGWRNWVGGN